MTTRAGVIGSPIGHSLSPAIFTSAFAAVGLDWSYEAYDVAEDDAVPFLERLRTGELEGISVTMPDKAAVIPGLDELDPVASDLQAVNCIARDGDRLRGHNTDGAGFLDALRHDSGIDVTGRRCVVVGAGGAGRAVALALHTGGAAEIVVVNRSASRAQTAVDLLRGIGRVGAASDIATADVVVNATSVGMGDGRLPFDAALLRDHQVVVDIVYQPLQTPLLLAAQAAGARTVDGLGMLVHQAAHAFRLWTGAEPPVDAMRAGAERALAERTGSR